MHVLDHPAVNHQWGSLRDKLGTWNMPQNEIRNMEYEHQKRNPGHSPYMKSGIWDHEKYPGLEYMGKRQNMKLGTWNKVSLDSI